MDKKTKITYLSAIVLALVLGFASIVAVAKNDSAGSKSSKSVKTSQSQGGAKEKKVNLKVFKQPDLAKGETHAQVHKEKSQEVTKTLREVANEEKTVGNVEVGKKVQQVATEQVAIQQETAEAIEVVEKRSKIKTFLIGADYKNLGQLRSDLVHNRNEIRKLTQLLTQTMTPENKALIESQLATLMQERERIKGIITANESAFSLFGWVSRFLFNYEMNPINEQEEEDLTDEVEDAIDEDDGLDTDPNAPPTSTAPTVPPTTTAPIIPPATAPAADTGNTSVQ